MPIAAHAEKESFQCCICLESFFVESSKLVSLTCCKPPSAPCSPLCSQCCVLLAQHGQFAGVGRCPLCTSYFRLRDPHATPVLLEVLKNLQQCRCCKQLRTILDEPRRLCDACVLGQRLCLVYECERCRGAQRIPHPMWRYQPSPTSFSGETWACQRCSDFTHWRVHATDAWQVPNEDAPESWGRREQWLDEVRALRHRTPIAVMGGSFLLEFVRLCCSPMGLFALVLAVFCFSSY